MGRVLRRRSLDFDSLGSLEFGPSRLAPAYRHRVQMSVKGAAPVVVWATNDRNYARELVARINALAGEERAWMQSWLGAEGRGQWVGCARRKKEPPRAA